jgi:hypothetical protein
MDKTQLENQYPVLKSYPVFREAVEKGEYIIANGCITEEIWEEKENDLDGRPLIIISRKAVERSLQPGPVAQSKGDTLEGNIRQLIGAYKPDLFIHTPFIAEDGKLADATFDTFRYYGRGQRKLLEITDAWEWQEATPEDEEEDRKLAELWNSLHPDRKIEVPETAC